eukprot:749821-Hanusia_phi.AAC.14
MGAFLQATMPQSSTGSASNVLSKTNEVVCGNKENKRTLLSHTEMFHLHQLADAEAEKKAVPVKRIKRNVRNDITRLMLTNSVPRNVAVDVEVDYQTSGVNKFLKELNVQRKFEL